MAKKWDEHEEKGGESVEEKWQRDPLSKIFFGLILVLLGLLLFLELQDLLQDILIEAPWWAYFLLGLGILFLLEVIVRATRPEYRRPYQGKLIAGVILAAIGIANIYDIREWWPLIIIIAGLLIIFLGFQRSKQP